MNLILLNPSWREIERQERIERWIRRIILGLVYAACIGIGVVLGNLL